MNKQNYNDLRIIIGNEVKIEKIWSSSEMSWNIKIFTIILKHTRIEEQLCQWK